jgi:hypothetical protein
MDTPSSPQLGPSLHKKKNSISEKTLARELAMSKNTSVVLTLSAALVIVCITLIGYGTKHHIDVFGEDLRPTMIWMPRDELPEKKFINSIIYVKERAWRLRLSGMISVEEKGVWPFHSHRLGLFEPVVHCIEEDRVGSFVTGGFSICGLSRLRFKEKCVVYIFSETSVSRMVEHDISEATDSNCEIHTFDKKGDKASQWEKESRKLVYHRGWPLSISQEMERIGHSRVDLMLYHAGSEDYELLETDFSSRDRRKPIIDQLAVVISSTKGRFPWRTFELVNLLEGLDMYQFSSDVLGPSSKILYFVNTTMP